MRLLLPLLSGLATTLSGQGAVQPFQLGQVSPLPGLNSGPVPAADVRQVHMVHLPGDPPNVFYCAADVSGLPATHGGVGQRDLLCGSYDVLTDTFTPNNDAAALNGPGDDVRMMLHHSGLHAVFDRPAGSPVPVAAAWLASRPAIGQPWQVVGHIDLCPCNFTIRYSPALADYQGQPHLLYVRDAYYGVVMAPIDLTSAYLPGVDTLIVSPPTPYHFVQSPIPVTDRNGGLIGVSHSLTCYDSLSGVWTTDRYLSLDLDPGTPPVLIEDTTNHLAGGFVGGRFFESEWVGSLARISAMDAIWTTGARAPVAGTAFARVFSPPTSGPEVYFSLIAASSGFLPIGQPYPGVQGSLGIDPSGAWATGLVQHDNRNGEARFGFQVPNVPALSGVRLPVQSATWEATSGLASLGNTAVLVVE